jgi:hypothetical protein
MSSVPPDKTARQIDQLRGQSDPDEGVPGYIPPSVDHAEKENRSWWEGASPFWTVFGWLLVVVALAATIVDWIRH